VLSARPGRLVPSGRLSGDRQFITQFIAQFIADLICCLIKAYFV
jgi:hypothetical protein